MNSFFSKNADFPTSVADLRLGIVDATELTGGDALYGSIGMDVITLVIKADGTQHEMVNMSHLELYGKPPSISPKGGSTQTSPLPHGGGWEGAGEVDWFCYIVEICQAEVMTIL